LLLLMMACACSILNFEPSTPGGNTGNSNTTNEGSSSIVTNNSSTKPDDYSGVELSVWIEGSELCWTDVSAVLYSVCVGEDTFTTADTRIEHSLPAGIYEVSVRAYFSVEPLKFKDFTGEAVVRAQPPVLTVDGRTLTWSAATGDAVYNVYKDGKLLAQVAENRFVAEEDGLYSVSVVYGDNRLSSDASAAVAVGSVPLSQPSIFLTGTVISWSVVPGAEAYVVLAEGEVATVIFGENNVSVDFLSIYNNKYSQKYPGGVNVCVYARSSGADDSPRSETVFFKP